MKNKASKGYEENYFFIFREGDGVYYNELETRWGWGALGAPPSRCWGCWEIFPVSTGGHWLGVQRDLEVSLGS